MTTSILRAEFYGYNGSLKNKYTLDGKTITSYDFFKLFDTVEKYVTQSTYYIYEAKIIL